MLHCLHYYYYNYIINTIVITKLFKGTEKGTENIFKCVILRTVAKYSKIIITKYT